MMETAYTDDYSILENRNGIMTVDAVYVCPYCGLTFTVVFDADKDNKDDDGNIETTQSCIACEDSFILKMAKET